MKFLNLAPFQAKAAAEKRLRRIVVPFNPQPIEYDGMWMWKGLAWGAVTDPVDPICKCPFSVGQVVGLKEEFYIDYMGLQDGKLPDDYPHWAEDNTYYRIDGECCEQIPECQCATMGKPRWRAASTMPWWAIRHHFTIISIEAKMLGQLTEWEAEETGVERAIYGEDEDGPYLRSIDDEQDNKLASFKQPFQFHWNIPYRRRPALAWRDGLWTWSLGGEVKG